MRPPRSYHKEWGTPRATPRATAPRRRPWSAGGAVQRSSSAERLRRPSSAERHGPEGCPGWWLHWSAPDKAGRIPQFCSVCGSRSLSRQRLRSKSASLRQQVELLQEIARQQQASLQERTCEAAVASSAPAPFVQPSLAPGAPSAVPDFDPVPLTSPEAEYATAQAAATRDRVRQLRRELDVWRSDGACRSALSSSRGGRDSRSEHEELRRRWEQEASDLRAAQEEVRSRTEALRRDAAAQQGARVASAKAQAASESQRRQEREEADVEREAAIRAETRLSVLRQEIQDERELQAGRTRQHEKALKAIRDEIALVERRLDVERELMKAQETQLRSIDATAEAHKAQVQKVQLEASELRASLQYNQATLRRVQ